MRVPWEFCRVAIALTPDGDVSMLRCDCMHVTRMAEVVRTQANFSARRERA
jgi:hypothetical protein